jgi:hypothetical protein
MAGNGNIDDDVLEIPGGTYRSVSLRSFTIFAEDNRTPSGSYAAHQTASSDYLDNTLVPMTFPTKRTGRVRLES